MLRFHRKRLLLLILFAFFTITPVFANYDFLGAVKNVERLPSGMLITCEGNNLLRIQFQKPKMFRVTLGRHGDFGALLDYPLVKDDWEPVFLQFEEGENQIEIQSSQLRVKISRDPCRLTVFNQDGSIINQDDPGFGIGWDGKEVRCWKTISEDEKFFGLGEKTGNLNKRGTQWEMWNSDVPGYGVNYDPIYQSIPFFIGMRDRMAYGIYFNNSYHSYFNMGAGNLRYYSFSAQQGSMDYFFIYGPKVSQVVETYTELTGRTPLWPRWALGYQQCRWSYYPESEVMRLAETFRDKKMPADVLYLDIHYMDDYRVFTWDKNRFPNPEEMLAELREMGFKVVTIIDPGVKADSTYFVAKEGLAGDHFVTYPDGEIFRGEVWPGVSYFPDFSRPATRRWWGGLLGKMLKMGVSGFWNDMNEPSVWGKAFPLEVSFYDQGLLSSQKKIHNLYGFLMSETAYEGSLAAFPNRRPFVITRAGFAGEQRFTTVWTGDNVASEDHLELGIRMLQGLGLSGIPFAGMDVGGFIGHPSPELFARWMQVGALTPFFRTHTHYGSQDQEPWSFGDEIEKINKATLQWRYQIIPYLYSLLWKSHQSGAPLIRPLFWHYQDDNRVYGWDTQNQFMVGKNLLAAPVTRENQYLKKLYLPDGKWIDLENKKVYEGGAEIIVEAPLQKMPVFLKGGGILPLREENVQWIGQKPMKTMTLLIFPADSGTFNFYQDDGETMAYRQGKYSLTRFGVQPLSDTVIVNRHILHDKYDSEIKEFQLRFLNIKKMPVEVLINGSTFLVNALPEKYALAYLQEQKVLDITVPATDFRAVGLVW